jgi:predicted MPP superfamily phosphohydrolase
MRLLFALFFIIAYSMGILQATELDSLTKDKSTLFWVIGDTRGDMKKTKINLKMLNLLKQRALQLKPKFIFVNGDLVSGYSDKLEKQLIHWRDAFMAPLLDAGIKVYVCRGNHDASMGWVNHKYDEALAVWNKVFSGKFAFPDNGPENEKNISYFVKDKNIIVFVMDNYVKNRHHRVNSLWMEQVLKNVDALKYNERVFVVCHEPAFAAQHKDALETKKNDRNAFVKRFLNNGGKYFFAGHDHFYDYSTVNTEDGIFHQFICGTAGAPLKNWNGKYSDSKVKQINHIESNGYIEVYSTPNSCVLKYINYLPKNNQWKIADTVKSELKIIKK